MAFLTDADKQHISEAIRHAEQRTSGELVTVIARASDDYLYIPLLWASLIALVLPGLLLYFPILWDLIVTPSAASATWGLEVDYTTIYWTQLAVFVVLALVFRWNPIKMRLIPRSVKHRRASRTAYEQFVAQGLHRTRDGTGVLIFVSVAEHFVEILADYGINEKVDEEAWSDIVSGFVQRVKAGEIAAGFLVAVDRCGALLAEHFPRPADDTNELPNHLVEI